MAFTLPPLPYNFTDLAFRGMSQETLEFHYAKHHQAYVVALNRLTEGQGLDGKSLETIVAEAGQAGADGLSVLNQAGQHWNHVLFWRSMSPRGGGDKLPAALEKKLNQDFGSFDKFKEEFTNAGMRQFGSGWVWLSIAPSGSLQVTSTSNGANPISTGRGAPILGVDLWEHAYYLDFRNARAAYLKNFLEMLVDWEFVGTLLRNGGFRSGQTA